MKNPEIIKNPVFKKIPRQIGLAVDIGTTTISAALVNLETQQELINSACFNSQLVFGEDVISRIGFCLKSRTNQKKLQNILISDINSLVRAMLKKVSMPTEKIYAAVLVGNTAMQQFFLCRDVSGLITPPYQAENIKAEEGLAGNYGINLNKKARIRFLPAIGGFVGADIVSEIVFLEISKQKGVNLIIDIGTNGEMVISHGNKIKAASCAAGPAFEGGQITCGMRAERGAIERVGVNNHRLDIGTVGNVSPVGICGSGLIDLAAVMLKLNLMDKSGRMKNKRFLLYENKRRKIIITQEDIRQLQLAKSAMGTGIEVLLRDCRISNQDISQVYICGVFGNYLNIRNAKAIGLLPDVPDEKIIFCGNAALQGAKRVLYSERVFKETIRLARSTTHLSLTQSKYFKAIYPRNLLF
ncbi:MAG: ASKHA domain-containing protein [Candidatus Omnitrophota bacterium]